MTDVFTKNKRSEIMSKIRSESALENRFCRMLSTKIYPLGFRYRRNYAGAPGKPDIVFVDKKLAIFIDGTFWHGYNFNKLARKLSKKFWLPKIKKNIVRDRKIDRNLRTMGWKVCRIWEHEIEDNPEKAVKKVLKRLGAVL